MTANRNFGLGVVRMHDPRFEHIDAMRLLEVLGRPDYRPPLLPAVALELVALSRKPSVTIRDMAQLLEQDPVLTADTLRIAQSPVYQGNSEIHSIDEALVRLGLRRTAELCFRAAFEAKVFRGKGVEAPLERLRRHSVITAELSRLVARETSLFDDSAYLSGLLHDVGIAGALLALADTRSTRVAAEPLPFEALWPVLAEVHAKFALHIAVLWNLPQSLRLVLSHHLTFATTEPVHPMAAVTYLAECLANQNDAGFAEENDGAFVERARKQLSIPEARLPELGRAAALLVEKFKGG